MEINRIIRTGKYKPLKDLPPRTTKVVGMMYGTKCKVHKHIQNNQHMTEYHGCFDLPGILTKYNGNKTEKEAAEE